MFAALGDETRLRVVQRLCREGPLSVAQLSYGARVTRQAVTKHLEVLERAGLAGSTRQGRETRWSLRPGRVDEARRVLAELSARWDAALERLRVFVETP